MSGRWRVALDKGEGVVERDPLLRVSRLRTRSGLGQGSSQPKSISRWESLSASVPDAAPPAHRLLPPPHVPTTHASHFFIPSYVPRRRAATWPSFPTRRVGGAVYALTIGYNAVNLFRAAAAMREHISLRTVRMVSNPNVQTACYSRRESIPTFTGGVYRNKDTTRTQSKSPVN